jgi:hypothetical protein
MKVARGKGRKWNGEIKTEGYKVEYVGWVSAAIQGITWRLYLLYGFAYWKLREQILGVLIHVHTTDNYMKWWCLSLLGHNNQSTMYIKISYYIFKYIQILKRKLV